MRPKYFALLAAALAAVLLLVTPLGAQAAKLITGKQVKDSSLTGKDVKNDSLTGKDVAEKTLGTVPSAKTAATAGSADSAVSAETAETAETATVAQGLTTLAPGASQSGAFSAAGANSTGAGGWIGFSVTYPQPLLVAIDESHIVDTAVNPDAVNCPAAGQAAPGYLCLYFNEHEGVADAYGYSTGGPYADTPVSVGVGLYAEVTGDEPYVDGVWTVTAPLAQ